MADSLSLDLVKKELLTNQIIISIGYDIADVNEQMTSVDLEKDWYGRTVPTGAHGSINLTDFTSSTREIVQAASKLFDRLSNKKLHVRRMYVACPVIKEKDVQIYSNKYEQLSVFASPDELENNKKQKEQNREEDKNLQKTILNIKNKYGKNAVLKGMDYEEGGTTRERNKQIGGHKA